MDDVGTAPRECAMPALTPRPRRSRFSNPGRLPQSLSSVIARGKARRGRKGPGRSDTVAVKNRGEYLPGPAAFEEVADLAAKTGPGRRSDHLVDDRFASSGIRGPVLRRPDQRAPGGGPGAAFRAAARGVHSAAL